ncbi:hypothetical protein DERF_006174 [Dermatophagoides farinae]|uniref:Uncharacterized protein n=1 Tax=Dermatophagoides farinae TaxID=6954 RepID=A0A922L7X0_DERFA|nr:hypothetical protein DERF_006174 [Dermatophagoides farinae]
MFSNPMHGFSVVTLLNEWSINVQPSWNIISSMAMYGSTKLSSVRFNDASINNLYVEFEDSERKITHCDQNARSR